ncbi:MAG TPA: hypothetical protein VI977_02140 [archaeon]|nr:hypothetical protein [archaeon]
MKKIFLVICITSILLIAGCLNFGNLQNSCLPDSVGKANRIGLSPMPSSELSALGPKFEAGSMAIYVYTVEKGENIEVQFTKLEAKTKEDAQSFLQNKISSLKLSECVVSNINGYCKFDNSPSYMPSAPQYAIYFFWNQDNKSYAVSGREFYLNVPCGVTKSSEFDYSMSYENCPAAGKDQAKEIIQKYEQATADTGIELIKQVVAQGQNC